MQLYLDYLKKEIEDQFSILTDKKIAYFQNFKANLLKGIDYYYSIEHIINIKGSEAYENMTQQLFEFKKMLHSFSFENFLSGHTTGITKNYLNITT